MMILYGVAVTSPGAASASATETGSFHARKQEYTRRETTVST